MSKTTDARARASRSGSFLWPVSQRIPSTKDVARKNKQALSARVARNHLCHVRIHAPHILLRTYRLALKAGQGVHVGRALYMWQNCHTNPIPDDISPCSTKYSQSVFAYRTRWNRPTVYVESQRYEYASLKFQKSLSSFYVYPAS